MRSFICGQCHVENYCGSGMKLTFPWGNGLKVQQAEAFWVDLTFADGTQFHDYTHKESDAKTLKNSTPNSILWSQGIRARSGVSCADCHISHMRKGAHQDLGPRGPQPVAQYQPRLPDLSPLLRRKNRPTDRRQYDSATSINYSEPAPFCWTNSTR